MTQLLVVLALFAIIIVHELGHLMAARWTGIRATVFSVGFGPALIQRNWRGTNWRVSAIPLGGYVRIPAIAPPDVEVERRSALMRQINSSERLQIASTSSLDELERAATEVYGTKLTRKEQQHLRQMADTSGLAAAQGAVLSWQLEADDAALIADAKTSQQLHDALSSARVVHRREQWDRLIDEHASDTYHHASWWRRASVILAGSAVNVVGGMLAMWLCVLWLTPLYSSEWQVAESKSAAVREGQVVVQLNQEGLTRSDGSAAKDLSKQAKANEGKSLLVLEGGKVVAVEPGSVTLRNTEREKIGYRDDIGVGQSARYTAELTWALLSGTVQVAVKAFYDKETRSQTGTVVGAVEQSPAAKDYLLQYVLVISIAIGLVNLLPLLPLDGGHFVMTTLRAIGVNFGRSAYYAYGAAGMAFVLVLFTIGLGNDIRAF